MQDDIRQAKPGAAEQPTSVATEPPKLKLAEDEIVDEQKIEEEFGVPNDDGLPPTDSEPPKPKLMSKLVPKVKPAKAKPAAKSGHKRPLIMSLTGLVILTSAAVVCFVILQRQPNIVGGVFHTTQKFVPKTVASTLTGLQVDPSVNDRTVTAVMIENSIDARPQSGLDQAGVVFEALAEGGVTRFMALFQDTQPDYLGPVRSARPYYLQWLLAFDAAYAHVGGSADALSDITAWHVKDLNQFYNSSAYERISSRYAPHNVYTSISALNQLESDRNFGKSNYTGFVRKQKETPSKTPTVTSIDIQFSGFYYDSHYDYDAATNTYKRSESGAAHMELHKDGTQVQIAPKVVIAMVVPRQNGALDASGAYYSDYAAIGSGQVLIFQDGLVTSGTWTKTDRTAQITFTDANGKPIELNPGQTWIAATPLASNVTYK